MGMVTLDTQILVLGTENIEEELLNRISTLEDHEIEAIVDDCHYLNLDSEFETNGETTHTWGTPRDWGISKDSSHRDWIKAWVSELFKMLKNGEFNLHRHNFNRHTIYIALLTTDYLESLPYRLINMIYCLPGKILEGLIEDHSSPKTTLYEHLFYRAKEEMLFMQEE